MNSHVGRRFHANIRHLTPSEQRKAAQMELPGLVGALTNGTDILAITTAVYADPAGLPVGMSSYRLSIEKMAAAAGCAEIDWMSDGDIVPGRPLFSAGDIDP